MDTEINSIDKSISNDDITLEQVLCEEIIIHDLSQISSNEETDKDDIISQNKLDEKINVEIQEGDFIEKNVIFESDINNLPEINLEEILNENNLNEFNNKSLSIDLDYCDTTAENNNTLNGEINLENNNHNLNKNNNQIISEILDNNIDIDISKSIIGTKKIEMNQEKQEDDISLDINERLNHNHGFIEQEIFENKLNIDSEFNISRDLTLAHNLDFTNSSDQLTKIQNFSNEYLNMSDDNDNNLNLEQIDLNLANFDGVIVNDLSQHNEPCLNKSNDNYIIQGTQFINGTIENSYILGSTLSNVVFEGKSNINKTEYLTTPLNGKISAVTAGTNIEAYQCVECYVNNGKLFVRPTSPFTKSPFFGIAQKSVLEGEIIDVLTEGISYLNVKNIIELPILKRVGNQIIFATDNKNNMFKQNFNLNIEKDDILVLTGSSNDILIGPSTKYFQFNNVNTNGSLTLYKSIQINFQSGSYVLNNSHLQTHQSKKMFKNNQFITVLDIDENGQIMGLLN